MSLLLRITLGLLILAAIIFVGWNNKHEKIDNTNQSAISDQQNDSNSLSSGNTDEDLDEDMMTIDGQFKVMEENSNEMDQSLDDKPVNE